MKIALSDSFTIKKLLKFVLPSIIMMVCTSVYGIVDGIFITNFVGDTAFTAINLLMPIIMILACVGFMIGTGGSAIISRTMGEGKQKEAKAYFSLLVYVAIILGIVIAITFQFILEYVVVWVGAVGEKYDFAVTYGRIILCSLPFFILQNVFQSYLVMAERPMMGLFITVGAGITNIVLDALFVGVLKFGVVGAAIATAMAECFAGGVPLVYFAFPNRTKFRLGRTYIAIKILLKTMTNGLSEFVTSVSGSVVSLCYNYQLLRLYGDYGVDAYGVLMYVNFLFAAVFIGYSVGSAPIVSYHYGADNKKELKGLLRRSMAIVSVLGFIMMLSGMLLAPIVANVFFSLYPNLAKLTEYAFFVSSCSFMIMGVNILMSSFFTALNNGIISGVIALVRTLVFQLSAVFILPLIFPAQSIWYAVIVAEGLSMIMSVILLFAYRKRYGYM